MITTETLAVSAIFIAGLYFGFKLKEAMYNLRNYLNKKRLNQ